MVNKLNNKVLFYGIKIEILLDNLYIEKNENKRSGNK